VAYCVVRSILLLTLEAPEPRYTLECFPIVIAFAAVALSVIFVRLAKPGQAGAGQAGAGQAGGKRGARSLPRFSRKLFRPVRF
jgi:hypothetical protein